MTLHIPNMLPTIALLFVVANARPIECGPVIYDDKDFAFVECTDITDAMNYLYNSFPDDMSLEERCKRYAILSSLSSSKGRPHNKVMSRYLRFSDESVDKKYQLLDREDELPATFMSAIDSYRAASQLGPAFLVLMDCLRQFDRPYIKTYLNDPELVLIVDIYKSILRSPDIRIDLSRIDLDQFTSAFRTSLKNLFRDNLIDPFPSSRTSDYGTSASDQTHIHRPDVLEEQPKKSDRQQDEEAMVTTHRHRERERLRKRRLKLLQPNLERFKKRERYRRRQERRKKALAYQSQCLQPSKDQHNDLSEFVTGITRQSSQLQSEVLGLKEQIPDLAGLWADAAPVYELIATPMMSEQQRGEYPEISQGQAPQNITTDSSTLNPMIQQATHLSSPPQLVHPIIDTSASIDTEPLSIRSSDPNGDPTRSFPCSSDPEGLRGAPSFEAPCDPIPPSNYPRSSETQSQLNLSALPTLDQFEDIESVLQSFPEVPPPKDDGQDV